MRRPLRKILAQQDRMAESHSRVNRILTSTVPKRTFEQFCFQMLPKYFHHKAAVHHKTLFELLSRQTPQCIERVMQPIAIAASRSLGKSTIVNLAFTLWVICEELAHYMVIIRSTDEAAKVSLRNIRLELEYNTSLLNAYPNVKPGTHWTDHTLTFQHEMCLEVHGTLSQTIRGKLYRQYRPEIVVLDDIEDDLHSQSPTQNQRIQEWIESAIIGLGTGEKPVALIMIGNIIRHDCVLERLLNKPAWHALRMPALINHPEINEHWQHWESLLLKGEVHLAHNYFKSHSTEMHKGAKLAWPEQLPLDTLKFLQFNNPLKFDLEFQQIPVTVDNIFHQAIHYWDDPPLDPTFIGAIDPAFTVNKSSDMTAILVGGIDRCTRKLHVYEAIISRLTPNQTIEKTLALQKQYKCSKWYVESVGAQQLLLQNIVDKGTATGIPFPGKGYSPGTTPKVTRIANLQPYLLNQQLLLRPNQTELIAQLQHFPHSPRDDGPDALAMLWELASKTSHFDPSRGHFSIPDNHDSVLPGLPGLTNWYSQ